MSKNKALFSISSLWLWHATRTLVVIKMYLSKNYEIDLISFWNALRFLKDELKWEKVNFIELDDYPNLERWTWFLFYFYLIKDILKSSIIIRNEHLFVKKIENNYDFIFSDGRYWIYSKVTPSFLLSHQLSFIMPKFFKYFNFISDYFNKKYLKNFKLVFIPDYNDFNKSLAWKLSHPKWINSINHKYIWILSSFSNIENKLDNDDKIDYLFIISWYLLENKQNFVNKLILQSNNLSWKKVFVLWDTSSYYKKELENNITIFSYISWKQREFFLKNSSVIISRSWYTTIMDCIELNKKAIFFPTKNQTEQEYLSCFLKQKNYFIIWNNDFNLLKLVWKLNTCDNFNPISKTKYALENIEKIINNN